MSFTPSITFNRYEKDSSIIDISSNDYVYASGTFTGEGEKTYKVLIVDPMEISTTSSSLHEFYYTVNPNSGTENFYQVPFMSGYSSGSKVRLGNYQSGSFIQYVWSGSVTEIVMQIDHDYGFEGSGSKQNISVPNSGTSWSPPFGTSGSQVLDVPRYHNATAMVVVQPTDWDQNPNNYLHAWQGVHIAVGHAVEVAGTDVLSGTIENSTINLYGDPANDYYINFKTYHESPKEWEWYSGATLMQSGTQSGSYVEDTWLFIDNLSIGKQYVSGSYQYQLKLFSSGAVTHPTPLRTVNININVPTVGGRFGIGRFGISRFGLE